MPDSPSVRRVICRQAMIIAVAEGRRKRKYAKQNLRQYPAGSRALAYGEADVTPKRSADKNQGRCPEYDRSSNSTKALPKRDCSLRLVYGEQLLRPARLPARIAAGPGNTGYKAIRMRCDSDVVDLSALTAMHVGKTTVQPLQASPSYIIEILRWKQWSYLSYIPLWYGNTKSLDDAVCCVAARVRQWITGAGE